MVNGKSPLIYGGGSPASTTAAKSRDGRYNRLGDSFASFLPKEEAAPGAVQPATAQATAAQLQSRAARPVTEQPSSGLRFHPGNYPDNYLSNARTFAAHQQGGSLPVGAQPRVQAREQAAPAGNPGWQGQVQQAQARQALMQQALMQQPHIQQARAAQDGRISGLPISGRGGFGMTDTRVPVGTPQGIGMADSRQKQNWRRNIGMEDTRVSGMRDMAALQKDAKQPGKNTDAVQLASAHSSFVGERHATDAYSQYAGRYGRDFSGHSFLSYGFGGKNAELALKKMGYDMSEARTAQTSTGLAQPDPYALNKRDYIPPADRAGRNTARDNTAQTRVSGGEAKGGARSLPEKPFSSRSLVGNFYSSASQGLGTLAAKFESGDEGIAAIGYDRTGGTSYGKYQIASRPGTMSGFIQYLEDKAPDLAGRLKAAGPANTGGRGGQMPAEWRKIAAEEPERFEKLQSDFIRTSHFEPAMQAISVATGVNFEQLPGALKEVLFSTAVQHGPAGATRIFSQALRRVDASKLHEESMTAASKKTGEQLISHIYNLRAGQFASSTSRVQSAVRSRLQREMREAMQMLA